MINETAGEEQAPPDYSALTGFSQARAEAESLGADGVRAWDGGEEQPGDWELFFFAGRI